MGLSNANVRATVAVSDIDAATRFYEGKLGLTPVPGEPMGDVRIYACRAGSHLQVYASEHTGAGSATVASWTADNFDDSIQDLAAGGVAFERYDGQPADERGVHAFGDHRVAWFRDPDGNILALDNGQAPS